MLMGDQIRNILTEWNNAWNAHDLDRVRIFFMKTLFLKTGQAQDCRVTLS